MKNNIRSAAAVLALLAGPAARADEAPGVANPGTPAPDCTLHVNYDRNADLPGYRSGSLCLPFIFYEPRTGSQVDRFGAFDPEGVVDLHQIRRPGHFAGAPYAEPIAQAEPRAATVEFTVPRDSYERRHLSKRGTIKLRGSHLQGGGVAATDEPKRRALVIMNNGGGGELTAIDDPRATGVGRDAAGKYVLQPGTGGMSEQHGMRHWRSFMAALNEAGFDVLVTDRRGNGISGGVADFNTAEQANDMFRKLDQMETGNGLHTLTPSGEMIEGVAVAGRLMGGMKATAIPVVLAGYSRGPYAVAWAMQKNFVRDCDLDAPGGACHPALSRPDIKGAILYGPNTAALGYRLAGHDMVEAALRMEYNATCYVDSDVLANSGKWPGVLIVKGIWDYVEGLEGSLEAYRSAREPQGISVFHGLHSLATQNAENMHWVGAGMVAFARAAVLGQDGVEGARVPADLKDLVLSSPDHWELTTEPR